MDSTHGIGDCLHYQLINAMQAGDGLIRSVHPDKLGWSVDDIAIYLESGLTPDFDTVDGEMVDVVDNTSKLTDADRQAIAAYLVNLN